MITINEIPLKYCEVYNRISEQLGKFLEEFKSERKYKIKITSKREDAVLLNFKLDRLERCIKEEELLKIKI